MYVVQLLIRIWSLLTKPTESMYMYFVLGKIRFTAKLIPQIGGKSMEVWKSVWFDLEWKCPGKKEIAEKFVMLSLFFFL